MRSSLLVRAGPVALAALATAGCAGLAEQHATQDFMERYARGEFAAAAEVLDVPRALADHDLDLLASLKAASALRALRRHADAERAFDQAEAKLLWKSDEIASVSDAVAAGVTLLGNDLALPYAGTIYDGVMVNTFKALGAWQGGDVARARVELNRADQRQTNAVRNLAVKVRAAARDEGDARVTPEQRRAAEAARAAASAPGGALARRLEAVAHLGRYKDLRNPFTDWLHGIFRLATGERNRASDLLRDAAALSGGEHAFVLDDFRVAETAARDGGAPAPRVWVIHEDGIGPRLAEDRFPIPVPAQGTWINVPVVLPAFEPGTSALRAPLVLTADGRSVPLVPLLDMDRYAWTEFEAGYDAVLARALTQAAVRGFAQVLAQGAANRQRQDNPLGAFLLDVGSRITSELLARADTRLWPSLPRTIAIASVPRPADGRLTLATGHGPVLYDAPLPAASFILLHVQSVTPLAPPTVAVTVLDR